MDSTVKSLLRIKRKMRVRKKVSGLEARPRLTVFRSAKHIYAQVIDDTKGVTLAQASTLDTELKGQASGVKKVDAALLVGALLAKRLQQKGVSEVVFDRNGFRYKGRVAAVAQSARDAGLKF